MTEHHRARELTRGAEKIEENTEEVSTAIYRFLSRNETQGTKMATEEELLLEIVDQLKDAYERDIKKLGDRPKDLDMEALYPEFTTAAKSKVQESNLKETPEHRRICSVGTFALGLVMASRIRRHYTHAPWFGIKTLAPMLDSHGGVSEYFYYWTI